MPDVPPQRGAAPQPDSPPLIADDPGFSSLSSASSNPAEERPATLPAGAMVGQYEIIRLLGKGGMGQVFLARDTHLGRLAALKFLTAPRHPEQAARFLAEARATARLSHENVVVIYEVGEHQERPFMALEHLKGQTLRQWINERKARKGDAPGLLVPPRRAVELMLPVVRALGHAHERGIVHRDLKPANIMLTETGSLKVLDFGIAKILAEAELEGARVSLERVALERVAPDASLTQFGVALGTVTYMAPEQWGADTIDHRVDLWAVGLMLYELLFGESPLAPLIRAEQGVVGLLPLLDLDTPLLDVRGNHPELGKLGAVIDRCLIKRKDDRIGSAAELARELTALLPASPGAARDEEHNPFAGLSAFQESDAERFFGRERAVHQALSRLAEQPLMAVVGPSGAGKSSFVRAGLIPALKQSGEAWEAFLLRPGPHPLAALSGLLGQHAWQSSSHERASAAALEGEGAPAAEREALVEKLRAEPGYLGMQLRARARRKRERLVLFIDQFEELYTLAPEADRRGFFACLAGVADDAGSPLRVVVSLRADFLDRLGDSYAALPELGRGFLLLPLDRAELCEALTRPLAALDYRFEPPALVDEMLDELSHTRGALPLLQFTAARLWERRDPSRRALTEQSYRELGGVAGTLARHADAVLGAMAPADKQTARALFLRLVTPERTRALVSLGELYEAGHGKSELRRALDRLLEARLLTLEGSGEDEGTVEIVHESLVANWPTLTRWLDEAAEDAAFLARLRSAAREWRAGGKREGLLWTGEAAEEAQRFAARHRGELTPSEKRFLEAVIGLARRARTRRRWSLVALIAGLIVVALSFSLLALRAKRAAAHAEEQAARVVLEKAEVERGAARARNASRMAAARERQADPTTALALVREIEPGSTPRGWSALARGLLDAGVARVLIRHDAGVRTAAFSPDSRRIVSSCGDRKVRVWNADGTGEPLILRGHDAAVYSAAFSPDGRRIVSTSSDQTVRVWNADGMGEPLILRGHDAIVSSAAFSPDGRRIVSASDDKTVRVWNADGTGEPLILRGHDEAVSSAAFSPDGRRIVSASDDKTVRVWNADGKGLPLIVRGHDAAVYSAAFSPDGRRIVSASFDKTVRVWNADGKGLPLIVRGHEGVVNTAAFSPDGRRIVSASEDKTVRVWNADGSGTLRVLRGPDEQINSAVFSPDGRRIVIASEDKSVWVWNADGKGQPLILRGHDNAVVLAAFSPDGRRIVSASDDQTVRVWNTDGKGQPLILRGHEREVTSAVFSPDGRRIVSASSDQTVRVWNADGMGEPLILRGHDAAVYSAAFSPDGRRIVSASADKTVRVWNADGIGEPLILRGHEAAVDVQGGGSFSPDGTRIVTASLDATVRVWSADGTGEPLVLRGSGFPFSSAAFSTDGTRIVASSYDKTVWVWSDLEPVHGPDDLRLWTATTYCPPIEVRQRLLDIPDEMARADLARCERRVREAQAESASQR